MKYRISETPSGRSRRWIRRKQRFPVPRFARPILILLAIILLGALAWESVEYALRSRDKTNGPQTASPRAPSGPASVPWQRDVIASLDEALRHISEGNLTQAEVSVDRASSIITAARLESHPAAPDFFDAALGKFDEVVAAQRQGERLTEHVTLARIELAQLRSALEPLPPNTPPALNATDLLLPRESDAPENARSAGAAAENKLPPGHVFVGAPKEIDSGAVLDPAALGGDFLDATNMPARSEILEPPSSRSFADRVTVQNLTIAGAAQTLDGIHWKNVTFVGTRLRYEGGELDLHDVRFIHCLFGFTADERGARIANTIARGQNTLLIE